MQGILRLFSLPRLTEQAARDISKIRMRTPPYRRSKYELQAQIPISLESIVLSSLTRTDRAMSRLLLKANIMEPTASASESGAGMPARASESMERQMAMADMACRGKPTGHQVRGCWESIPE